MRSCSTHHWVLFLLTLTFSSAPTLAVLSVKVKLNHTAALPCRRRCSGWVQWTMSPRRDVVLARCDQSSCRSLEGYGMSHHQYLKGNFSLSITAADYSKRGLYTCECDSRDICDISLSIETMMSVVHKKPGEALVMNLPLAEPVEVIYNPTAGQSGAQICTVSGDTLRCKAEYTHRASLSHSALQLTHVNLSDSGVYIIQDMRSDEVIHMYTVTVEEDRECSQKQKQQSSMIAWLIVVMILLGVVFVLVVLLLCQRRQHPLRQQKQELVSGRAEKKAEPDPLPRSEKAWKRSYSDTALYQLRQMWVEKENLKHRHMSGAGRGHGPDGPDEPGQMSAHMPLLSEEGAE